MTEGNPRTDLEMADIRWSEGRPVSNRFDDIYYSSDDGLRESHHVFVAGNHLEERWHQLTPGQVFRIVETGFGSGLNFLCAASLWLAVAPPGARLEFVSLEKYPLSAQTMARALDHWPELGTIAAELLSQYPPLVAGVHRLWLYTDRICLTLVFDDAARGLSELLASDHPAYRQLGNPVADAWFLDGFAPAKNPELWSPELFRLMACFSGPQTTLATFTVARVVREGLIEAGFSLDKKLGFGRKRDMLAGRFGAGSPPLPPQDYVSPPVLRNGTSAPSWQLRLNPDCNSGTVVIIGAGIAGCATAAALRRRGRRAILVDRHGLVGQEASGNPQGILYPRLSSEDSPLALFTRHALCHALNLYPPYWASGGDGQQCGVLAVPEAPGDGEKFARLGERFRDADNLVQAVTGATIRALAGVELAAESGLFFPRLGWVSPPAVCRWLVADTPLLAAEIAALHREGDQWLLIDGNGQLVIRAPTVVIAASHGAANFPQTNTLPLRQIRGQITAVPATSASAALRTVICGAGYLAPSCGGLHTLGASYGVDDSDTGLREADHLSNLATLGATDASLPELVASAGLKPGALAGRAAVRCTTPDYLPLVGPVADQEAMAARFADLTRNARADIPLAGSYVPGMWLNCGLGSRGLTYGPMAAELLASQLCGDFPPLPRPLVLALHPARYIIRRLKRNQPG